MSLEDSPENVGSSGPPLSALSNDDKQWAMLAHLSALVAALAGGLTFIGPLIVWLLKKDQSPFVEKHAKEALNFQLNILIYYLISIVVTVITCGLAIPLPLALLVFSIVMPIIAGLKANKGEYYEYPLTIRFIK